MGILQDSVGQVFLSSPCAVTNPAQDAITIDSHFLDVFDTGLAWFASDAPMGVDHGHVRGRRLSRLN
jgi:hypothetical protein